MKLFFLLNCLYIGERMERQLFSEQRRSPSNVIRGWTGKGFWVKERMAKMKFEIKKKLIAASLAGAFTLGAGIGTSHGYAAPADRECIAQVALLQSLAQGYFGGTVTAGQLRALGDTGIGTFEGLNGEMIVLDGTVYQALGSGKVVVAPDTEIIPFSNVTFFDKDISVKLSDIADKAALEKVLNISCLGQWTGRFW